VLAVVVCKEIQSVQKKHMLHGVTIDFSGFVVVQQFFQFLEELTILFWGLKKKDDTLLGFKGSRL